MASPIARLRTLSLSTWTVLAACAVTTLLSLQTLNGRSLFYDEGVYWQSLRAMADGHLLFSSIFSSQPPLFLASVYPFYVLFGESLAAARVALLVFSIAGIIGTYVAGRALGSGVIGAVACLLLALDPLYERSAHTLQAQLPSVALQVWAVACAIQSIHANEQARRWLALSAGILLACASLMKLFAMAAFVPVVLFFCTPFFQWLRDNPGQTTREIAHTALEKTLPALALLAVGFLGAAIVLALPFIGRLDALYDQVVRFHLVSEQFHDRSVSAAWKVSTKLGNAPLLYVAALSVFVIVWRRIWIALPLILWALAGFVVLLNVRPLFNHHIVLFSPALALISGCGAVAAWQAFQAPGVKRFGLIVTILVLVAAGIAGLSINAKQNRIAKRPPPAIELEMAKALGAVTAPGDVVLTDAPYVAGLADRDVPPQVVDTSHVRIKSGYLTDAQLMALVVHHRIPAILFATNRLSRFKRFRARVDERYKLAARFGKGKALFVLHEDGAK